MWRPALPASTSTAAVRNRAVSTSDAHSTGPGEEAALFECLLGLIACACIPYSGCKTPVFKEGSVCELESN